MNNGEWRVVMAGLDYPEVWVHPNGTKYRRLKGREKKHQLVLVTGYGDVKLREYKDAPQKLDENKHTKKRRKRRAKRKW
jgi:hypothetical protein